MPAAINATSTVATQGLAAKERIQQPDSPLESQELVEVGEGHIASFTQLHPKQRPLAIRCSTDPLHLASFSAHSNSRPASRPRNRSPYSRSHLRSRSSGAALGAPPMVRAHSSPAVARPLDSSMPGMATPGSSSKTRSPARQRSPFQPQEDSTYNPPSRSPAWFESSNGSAIQAIEEDRELDITPRQQSSQPTSMYTQFARSSSLRRRPASPLHNSTVTIGPASYSGDSHTPSMSLITSSGSNSPSLMPQRYNEAYPPLHHYASSSSFSSVPTTPTSQRSRSPSISSLETIEDAPDLESEAIEAERLEKLKLAAEKDEGTDRGNEADEHPLRRGSFDAPRGFGFSRGGNREKKRWSVCGGERRADLDLETIWED